MEDNSLVPAGIYTNNIGNATAEEEDLDVKVLAKSYLAYKIGKFIFLSSSFNGNKPKSQYSYLAHWIIIVTSSHFFEDFPKLNLGRMELIELI